MNMLIALPNFLSNLDEARFFEAIISNPATVSVRGIERSLEINIDKRKLSNDNLRELIALLFRYQVALGPLAEIANGPRHTWIRDSDYYWYTSMFPN